MSTRVWSARSRLLTVAGLVLLVVGLVWITTWLLGKTNSADGAGIANVLALPIAVLGLPIGLMGAGLWSRPRADDPAVLIARARVLLERVIIAEERTLRRLLGDDGQPSPADVGFLQPDAAVLHWRTDGGTQTGSLNAIAQFYRKLHRGRLVILGEAGAGKTVLATRLLLDLATNAHTAAVASDAERISLRVPIRLSLPAFTATDITEPSALRERLDAWIAVQVAVTYRVETAVARALVNGGWVLPILDGLDEMDPDGADPVRARAVTAALNLPAGPNRWAVIVACRTTRYHQLTKTTGQTGLQDATVVKTQQLHVEQVIAWLAHRFPAPAKPDGVQARWNPVIAALRADPTGPLATCLTTPLRLFLAVTAYQSPNSIPHELIELAKSDLDDHLFSSLIPAVTAHHPGFGGGHYDPEDVERWLRTFADHLVRMRQRGRSGIDLYLHELSHPTQPSSWRSFFAAPTLPGLLYIRSKPSPMYPLQWLNLGLLRTPEGRRRLVGNLVFGSLAISLTMGLLVGFAVSLQSSFAAGLDIGTAVGSAILPIGIAAGLIRGLTDLQHTTAHPSQPLREALARDLVYGMLVAFSSTIWVSAVFILLGKPKLAIPLGLLGGIPLGITYTFRRSPWLRYMIIALSLAHTRHLPTRPARFLDWAYTAGLVRLAGIAVQFRHRDLQDRLTTQEPPPNKADHPR